MTKDTQVVLALVTAQTYRSTVERSLRALSKKKVIYVSFNQTCAAWREWCEKKRVNVSNMLYVDVVSSSFLKAPKEKANCVLISTPSALTELAIVITEALKGGFAYLVFDSLTGFAVHATSDEVASFVASLSSKLHDAHVNGLFYAIKEDPAPRWVAQVKTIVDKVQGVRVK